MNIIKLTTQNKDDVVSAAVEVLKSGGLFIFPTETVYGIGADATNTYAIDKLNKYKTMRKDKPYSIVVTDEEMAEKYVELNSTARNLYKNFLPGPLTVVSQGKHKVSPGVESPTGTLGIRIPDYPIVVEIARKFDKPFTATSANASYKKKPYTIDDILKNTSRKQQSLIDLIIDVGALPRNKPSTVLDTTMDDIQVTRVGDKDFRFQNEYVSKSEDDTYRFAAELIDKYRVNLHDKALIIALQGEMGAGKTYFTKGLAKALGVSEIIQSPTFVLSREYDFSTQISKGKLIHIDTWRMYEKDELIDLGLEGMVKPGNVISIEWADKFTEVVSNYGHKAIILWIDIQKIGLNSRSIKY